MGDPDIDDGRNEHSAVTSEREARLEHGGASPTSRMVNPDNGGSQGGGKTGVGQGMEQSGSQFTRTESDFGMADTASSGRQYEPSEKSTGVQSEETGNTGRRTELSGHGASTNGANETNGFWRDTDWLLCRDGKWRPVEPDTFPLAHGATARVGRLRAYGNAITAQVAQGLIESYMEVKEDG